MSDPIDAIVDGLFAAEDKEAYQQLLGHVMRRSDLGHLPPLTPLVKGLLDYPAAAVLIGGYGAGKTFLVLSLACCVATGRPWLGRHVERRRVLIVVGEGGSGLDQRIAAWEQGYNEGEPVGDDDLTVIAQPHSLKDPKVWQRLSELCAADGYGFVVLDTFSSLAPDADEVRDAPFILAQMLRLAAGINGTVLLVHHPGWSDNGRARGGYQFEGNADIVLILTGTPDEPLVSLKRKKIKDGVGGQVWWLRRSVFQLAGQHLGRTSVVLQAIDASQAGVPYRERILAILEACGDQGATGPQVVSELGGGDSMRSGIYKALNKAVEDGLVVKQGKGNQQRYYLRGTQ